MLGKLIVVAAFAAILYNLGAGLYYMMTDKGTTDRTLHALTRRITLSVALIMLVMAGIWAGWIHPHGVNG
ncbi:twin transmembrane helix small protein [Dokdonella soli]|uniref:Twin transmembrane helix small protein n=1 Tax=Dokdonella soli TaxID=529810 RepID=A0ABN1IMG6_9GAMM